MSHAIRRSSPSRHGDAEGQHPERPLMLCWLAGCSSEALAAARLGGGTILPLQLDSGDAGQWPLVSPDLLDAGLVVAEDGDEEDGHSQQEQGVRESVVGSSAPRPFEFPNIVLRAMDFRQSIGVHVTELHLTGNALGPAVTESLVKALLRLAVHRGREEEEEEDGGGGGRSTTSDGAAPRATGRGGGIIGLSSPAEGVLPHLTTLALGHNELGYEGIAALVPLLDAVERSRVMRAHSAMLAAAQETAGAAASGSTAAAAPRDRSHSVTPTTTALVPSARRRSSSLHREGAPPAHRPSDAGRRDTLSLPGGEARGNEVVGAAPTGAPATSSTGRPRGASIVSNVTSPSSRKRSSSLAAASQPLPPPSQQQNFSLQFLPKWCRLDLSWNNIQDMGARRLASALNAQFFLTSVDVSYNGLSSSGSSLLQDMQKGHATLRHLQLQGNELPSTAPVVLSPSPSLMTP